MASIVKIKRSSVQGKSPTTSTLETGEIAINVRDGKIFSSDGSNIVELGANSSSASFGTATFGNTNITTFDSNSDWYYAGDLNLSTNKELVFDNYTYSNQTKINHEDSALNITQTSSNAKVKITGGAGLDLVGQANLASIKVNNAYTLPTSDGTADNVLTTDGDGNVSWVDATTVDGLSGDKGQKGQKGSTGSTGSKGQKGQAGTDGNDGSKGQKGQTGSTGSTGDKGQKGESGSKGQKGQTGSTGSTGDKGQKGEVGSKGQKGQTGSTGSTGSKGQKGEVGATGDKGNTGETGQKGQKGQTGSTGSTGDKGQKGQAGTNGNDGSKGQKGQTGSDGSAGDKGQKGQTGSTGSTGSKGQKGEVGSTGDKGQKGEVGATGDKGQKGEVGATGSDGSAGDKGQKGQTGSTGSTGSKGQKGETGVGTVTLTGDVTGTATSSSNEVTITTQLEEDVSTARLTVNNYVKIETTGVTEHPSHGAGQIFWCPDQKAVSFHNDISGVSMQLGHEEWVRVKNVTGSTITNGTPVYATGESGGIITIAPSDATTEEKSQVIGVATADIADSAEGVVTVRGLVNDIDTSALTAGSRVHVGANGAFQTAAPTYPYFPTDVGTCVVSHASTGKLYVSLIEHTMEQLRITGNQHVDGNLTVDGDLTITGDQSVVSQSSLAVEDSFVYLNSGDTVANTGFDGTGLNDANFTGHYEGTSSVTYYVEIDGVGTGTGGVDTFKWSKDDFSTTEASTVDIDTDGVELDNGISITFNADTGHTSGDQWQGDAAPVNVDSGWFSNRNTGGSGVGYTHMGIFFDVSDEKFKIVEEYDPEPEGTINTGHASYNQGTLVGTFEGDLTGDVTGDVTGNASTATALATARSIGLKGDVTGSANFDGSGNVGIAATIDVNNVTTTTDVASDDFILVYDTSGSVTRKATITNAALQGTKGQKGQTGSAGSKGQKGQTGSKGQKGQAGTNGNDGSKGQKGQAGTNGNDGSKGQKGAAGSAGSKGQKGQTGSAGSSGSKGQKGQTGSDGSAGDKGQKGQTGSGGSAGAKGQKGQTGTNGNDGSKGQKGQTGSKGQKGAAGSAGSKGQKGQTGSAGSSGSKGQKGSQSVTSISTSAPGSPSAGDVWYDSEDGELYMYYNDGNTSQWVQILSGSGLDELSSDPSPQLGADLDGNGNTIDLSTNTDAIGLPSGTTAQRPSAPSAGDLRWNTTDTSAEIYDGSEWGAVGGGSGIFSEVSTGVYETAAITSATLDGDFIVTGDITSNSDERLKDNIETIQSALEKVLDLRGVEFDKNGTRHLGLIAQEVENIIPEVVTTASDEMQTKSVAYGNIVGLLVEAIKEQNEKIKKLENK